MDNTDLKFGFNVLRIVDCGFAIEETIEENIETTTVGYAMNLGFDIEESWLQINIRTDFVNPEMNLSFATGTVLTRFGINNLKSYLAQDGLNIIWPPNAMESMFSIAFSHMRAIIAKNLGGTKFEKYIVPLIKPVELFHELYQDNVKRNEAFLKNVKAYEIEHSKPQTKAKKGAGKKAKVN